MKTVVIKELNDLLEALVNGVDLYNKENSTVLFDRDFIIEMFNSVDGTISSMF